ncbi:uncharacterized protein N7459_004611 [Penicillium hispanicum]|uniref:uncharacterized protein n=1 Tax=Penicillium hispanicum TaxID=1080232 RepID=UPI00254201AF|nr:uncharacterized protein N7459_004611 [Penicillium hispanicum]KAJ5584811.1 hypothetical protein N7459_004611 [Penicillium hispanicum]
MIGRLVSTDISTLLEGSQGLESFMTETLTNIGELAERDIEAESTLSDMTFKQVENIHDYVQQYYDNLINGLCITTSLHMIMR